MNAFITATGTDIGKTFVACGLIRALRARNQPVVALKPVASGFNEHDVLSSDPAHLARAQGLAPTRATIDAISPWRFAAPLSPDWAAAIENRTIDYAELRAWCSQRLACGLTTIIEGAGGVMVPLDTTHTLLDLMSDLALPIVLVAGSYLGTISHTLTALHALRARGLRAVVCLNQTEGCSIDLEQTAARIERLGAAPTICLRRADIDQQAAAFRRLEQEITRSDPGYPPACASP